MIRRWIATLLNEYLGWAVAPINASFDFLLGPVTETYLAYKSQVRVAPGLFEQLIAVAFLIAFLAVGVAGLYVLLDFLSMIVDPVYRALVGGQITKRRRLQAAIGGYAGLQLMEVIATGELYVLEMTTRIAEDLAVVLAMAEDALPTSGVGITGFTWGLLSDPVWEFMLQVGLLILGTSLVVWKFTTWSEQVVTGALMVLSVGAYVYASVQGIQVFPLDVRLAFPLQLLVLLGVMSAVAGVLSLFVWGLLEWFPWVRYDQTKPRKLYMTFDGLVLVAMFPIFASNVMAVLGWVSYKLFRHGGGETAARVLAGFEQECEVDPETGTRRCHWTRGD